MGIKLLKKKKLNKNKDAVYKLPYISVGRDHNIMIIDKNNVTSSCSNFLLKRMSAKNNKDKNQSKLKLKEI